MSQPDEKLHQLLRVLHSIPNRFIDMQAWTVDDCSTPLCLAGHACVDEWFVSQGLYLGTAGVPQYKGQLHFDALLEFFELSMVDTQYLFGYSQTTNPISKRVLARRIHRMIEGKQDHEHTKG